MSADPRRLLRDAFGTFMTGVTVVTTTAVDGAPLGFTANSFTSVSLDPPLLLVAIAKRSQNLEAFSSAPHFAVNILAEDQKDVSNRFARPVPDRFAGLTWHRGEAGAPLLEGVSAWFECSRHDVVDAGDHVLLIGRIGAFDTSARPGLGYYRGAYFTAAQEVTAASVGPEVTVSAIVTAEGRVALVANETGGLAVPSRRVGPEGLRSALRALLGAVGVPAEPGFIYSVWEDVANARQHIAFLCRSERADSAAFHNLDGATLAQVGDPAQRDMLQRFAAESAIGDYGIYVGDHVAGEVRPIAGIRP